MDEVGVRRIVFSSSATVYGVPEYLPLDEKLRTGTLTIVTIVFCAIRELHEPLWYHKVCSGEDDDGLGGILREVECHPAQVS